MAFPHISEGPKVDIIGTRTETRTRAYAQCEIKLCRSLFRREAKDVPAELVSGNSSYTLQNVLSDVIACFQ